MCKAGTSAGCLAPLFEVNYSVPQHAAEDVFTSVADFCVFDYCVASETKSTDSIMNRVMLNLGGYHSDPLCKIPLVQKLITWAVRNLLERHMEKRI